jgi:hypothetical protein
MAGDRRQQPWAVMLQQNDDKHEDAHRRLRTDIRIGEAERDALTLRVQALEAMLAQTRQIVTDNKEQPIDIGKIVFDPKMVVAIVGLAVAIVGGNWFINQPIRDGLTVLQGQVSGNTKLEDERAKVFKEAVDGLTRQMEMRRLEIQQVSNSVQQLQRSPR